MEDHKRRARDIRRAPGRGVGPHVGRRLRDQNHDQKQQQVDRVEDDGLGDDPTAVGVPLVVQKRAHDGRREHIARGLARAVADDRPEEVHPACGGQLLRSQDRPLAVPLC